MEEKVCIFIDGSNFFNALKERFKNLEVDYFKFSKLLNKGRTLIRTYYYTASYKQEDNPSLYKKQQKFFNYLRNTPYLELRLGRKEKRPIKWDQYMQKDIQIVLDSVLERVMEKISEKFDLSDIPVKAEELKAFVFELYDKKVINNILSAINEKSPKIVEKGVDVTLASEMIDLAYQNVYETAIIVSADGDYVRAVEVVKRMGKHVENAFFEKAPNIHLRNACDVFIPITKNLINKCSRSKKA